MMYPVSAKRGRCVSLLMLMMLISLACAGPFSWSDCGIQLNKAIHYQSAAISPEEPAVGDKLAINVQATISPIYRKIIDAETQLMVWKDGSLFMNASIDKLCSILSNNEALSCPLYEGLLSFTYEFDKVPSLPSGEYVIQVKHYDETPGLTENMEIGCIQFTGTVNGLTNKDPKNCTYESFFNVQMKGDAHYTNADVAERKSGDKIQIGPIGDMEGGSSFSYGVFAGDITGTPDIGIDGTRSTTGYSWTLNGTLTQDSTTADRTLHVYVGNFYIYYTTTTATSVNMQGYFNWTFDYASGRPVQVTGLMWLDPKYYVENPYEWPVVIGNLGPFSVRTLSSGNFAVSGSHSFCTCGVDACGVCNGDGRTCGVGVVEDNSDDWGSRKIAAVACGVVGFLLLILVVDLSRRIRREKRKMPIDDQDLLDHPEKPDYGTLAIDDAIREGERVV